MACLRSRLVAALLLVLPACAEVPTAPRGRDACDEANDPSAPLNREFFWFNMFLDRNVFKPVAKAYVYVVPERGRTAIRSALDNMGEPVVFANNLMQGEFRRAGITVFRFMGNTMIGVGGLVDVATRAGAGKQSGHFRPTPLA